MILREYSTQRVIPQGIEFQIIRHDGGQKAAVHLPVDDPVPDLIIVAVQNLHIHLGIVLLKIVDDLRHPQGRDAGKAAHPQFALYLVVDVERRLPQPGFLVCHLPDIRQQPGAVVRQGHAPVDTGEQLHLQFFFQSCHHLAATGLRIVQRFRRFREAARLAHFQENLVPVFLLTHGFLPLQKFIGSSKIIWFTDILSCAILTYKMFFG